MVLQVVRLVEDQTGPARRLERVDVLREDVVVDDDPVRLPVDRAPLLDDVCRGAPDAAIAISRAQFRFTEAGQTTR